MCLATRFMSTYAALMANGIALNESRELAHTSWRRCDYAPFTLRFGW